MFVSESLKLNRFREVDLPRPRRMFERYGLLKCPATQYTGDDFARVPGNKVDVLADMDALDRSQLRSEYYENLQKMQESQPSGSAPVSE